MGVIDFSSSETLESDVHSRATDIFHQIVAQFEPSQTATKGYKSITLLRTVHEWVISKGGFLRCLFLFIEKELHQ